MLFKQLSFGLLFLVDLLTTSTQQNHVMIVPTNVKKRGWLSGTNDNKTKMAFLPLRPTTKVDAKDKDMDEPCPLWATGSCDKHRHDSGRSIGFCLELAATACPRMDSRYKSLAKRKPHTAHN